MKWLCKVEDDTSTFDNNRIVVVLVLVFVVLVVVAVALLILVVEEVGSPSRQRNCRVPTNHRIFQGTSLALTPSYMYMTYFYIH